MSSLNIYCEWTNGILFLSSWNQLCLKVHSACFVAPHFPSLLFQRLWSWGQFAFTVNFQRLTLKFLQVLFLNCAALHCWASLTVLFLRFLVLWQLTSTQALNTVNWHNTLKQRVNKHRNRLCWLLVINAEMVRFSLKFVCTEQKYVS